MKRNLLNKIMLSSAIVLSFLFINNQAQAQEKSIRMGLKAAPSFSWVSLKFSDDGNLYDSKSNGVYTGFTWGFSVEKFFAPNYSLSTGFNMNFVGGKTKFITPISSKPVETYTQALKYIEIPLMIKMLTNPLISNLKFYGTLGVAPGYCITAEKKTYTNFLGETIKDPKFKSIMDQTKPLRVNFAIGGGAEYLIDNSTTIFAGIIYNNGLTNIHKKPKKETSIVPNLNYKSFLNSIEIQVGLFF